MIENQKFEIELDGVVKTAEVIKLVTLGNKDYAIYAIDRGDETSDILASRLQKDAAGNDTLVDLETEEEKTKMSEIVKVMFS